MGIGARGQGGQLSSPQHTIGNPGLELGPSQNVAGLNSLMGFQPSPLDNGISNTNTYIIYKTDKKNPHSRFHFKKPLAITKMNINMDSTCTITGSLNAHG
jgi:hypothetical protein